MSKNSKAKVLFYDIETFANKAYVWGKYEQNVIAYEKEWEMLSFAYKWAGEKTVYCEIRKGKDDTSLLKKLWKLLDEADVVIAHNGDAFDNKKANARFAILGMPPVSPYRSIDTKKVAKRYFKFNSNSLNDLGVTLGLGKKAKHQGFDTWLGCMAGDKKSWASMIKYNKQDVLLLEKVYVKLLPWISNHPNLSVIDNRPDNCPKCGHDHLQARGIIHTQTNSYQRYQCLGCFGWSRAVANMGKSKPHKVNL